jgi:hypothetical protein
MSQAGLTRRTFVSSFAAPAIVRASDKSGSKRPVVGAGPHRFEVIHDWGETPKSIAYGNTHGVCVDSQGHVYIHHTVHASSASDDTMVVFDRKGRFVRSWGREFKGGAHGLHIRKEGRDEYLYMCDTKRGLVVKTTLEGREVFTLGYPAESPAYQPDAGGKKPRYSPTNLAIAPDGRIFVGDGYGSHFINVYGANGKFLQTYGGRGKGEGQLDCPHGIVVDTRGKEPLLLVADRANRRFQYFSLDGGHLRFAAAGDVRLPCHFHQRKGLLLVPDLEARVTLMDSANRVLAHLGEGDPRKCYDTRKQPREAFAAGQFVCPHSACFDHDGNILVVEWVEVGRVTMLRRI